LIIVLLSLFHVFLEAVFAAEPASAVPEAVFAAESAAAVPEAVLSAESASAVPEAVLVAEPASAVPEAVLVAESAFAVPEVVLVAESAFAVPAAVLVAESASAVSEVVLVAESAAAVPEVVLVAESAAAVPEVFVDTVVAVVALVPVFVVVVGVDSSGHPRYLVFPNVDYSSNSSSFVEVAAGESVHSSTDAQTNYDLCNILSSPDLYQSRNLEYCYNNPNPGCNTVSDTNDLTMDATTSHSRKTSLHLYQEQRKHRLSRASR
jgi:hypothetical protein